MAPNIIPFIPPHMARRTVTLRSTDRSDMRSVLEMLRTIDPELIARFAPRRTQSQGAPSGSVRTQPDSVAAANARDLLQPPLPANTGPALPRPDIAARTRTLTSLVLPDGSANILTAEVGGASMTLCLR